MQVESSKTLRSNMLIMLPLLTVQSLGAFILNWHLFSSSSLGNYKNAKNTAFLTRNPYRLGSFQLGARNMSKIKAFSENIVFYAIKLNHHVLHSFPGARTLICPFPFSLVMIHTKTMELSTGILIFEKTMELRTQNAQLPWCPNDFVTSRHKLPWKWVSRSRLRRKRWELYIKRTIPPELSP